MVKLVANYLRLLKLPTRPFFLFGPRGTGKSTWLHQHLSDGYLIDLLNEGKYQELLARPQLFAEEISGVEKDRWVIVDEAQRLPNLLNEVHRLIEKEGRKFALCGSSARKLRQVGVNLLAGRATRRLMFPLLPEEMSDDFTILSALQIGTLPLVVKSTDPVETLKDYVQMYLREEIQAEAIVRNLPAFARFLPVAALFHGQVLNISSLARDAGAHRNTIAGYIEVLEDTLLAFRLPAYQPKLKVKEQQHPKLYFVDAGIVRSIKKQLGPLTIEEKGALFEGWVCNLLRALINYRDLADDLFYWAPADSKTEVDFLLVKGNSKVAIEAKSSENLDNEDYKGLRAIKDLSGLKRRIIVYGGAAKRVTNDGIEILPVKEFIVQINTGLF
jgi:predicted AAA+ superfamily ATPase